MKKTLILLLLVSFCGGSAEPYHLLQLMRNTLTVEEELPNEEKQILEENQN